MVMNAKRLNIKIARKLLRLSRLILTGRTRRANWRVHEYGSWLSPKGEVVPLSGEHEDTAAEILQPEETDDDFFSDPNGELLSRGWVRVVHSRDYLAVESEKSLTSSQQSELLDLLQMSDFKQFVFSVKGKEVEFLEQGRAEKFLRAASSRSRKASWDWHDYGAWLLPNGDIIRVEQQFQHETVAKRYIEETEDEKLVGNVYREAFRRGWARLVFYPDLAINFKGNLSSTQRSELLDLIDDTPRKHIIIEHHFKTVQTEDPDEAKDMLRAASQKS